jgi:tripeptide aminopeptidase
MVDGNRLLNTFLSLVRIDSPSGQESAIREALVRRLRELGLKVQVDDTGNVLGRLEGEGEPLLLSAHMDTVPGVGIQPVVNDGLVCSDGTTILGADDKSGLAVILEALETLRENGSRPALEVALSVGEEVGLVGVKGMDMDWFRARQALVLDMGGPINEVVSAAPVSDKFDAVVYGRAAHAGSNPEDGINAIAVAARGIARMPLGRIDDETTANIGVIEGGQAVNVVPDWVSMRGEARSHDVDKLDAQIATMCQALQDQVDAHPGARLEVHVTRSYQAYRLAEDAPALRRVAAALQAIGEGPLLLKASGGGSDANVFNERGIVAVPISTGMSGVHTNRECITVADMVRCAELVLHALLWEGQGEKV